ncbi:PD-(D/E)XK nuclease family protein [Sporolactobacillus sp. STSJ-5]|uniref:PD-(D/E)XK nuclease family protein n=1 Tax=Sporolactobacillus sp. STSJ-5 TaxID=2965076 RepID=UPI0021048AE0|nr:PD-(D/E)XK nuclease family protein [Sporolactobacillus sp. STSJ-5]MCQ2011171.1 PD-(D/E)XK nuclease family protein [Sporolactobacillus sp. STSJ-5]
MLAEIHHKIAKDGSNLSERLEDNLTSDFFGAIRYLPFEQGMREVLLTAEFDDHQLMVNWSNRVQSFQGYPFRYRFWHKIGSDEIDLLLIGDDLVIGIEVKLYSGLSSEDEEIDPKIDYETSKNQLARYSAMMEKNFQSKKDKYLLFVAPYQTMSSVKARMQSGSIISPDVQLGFMNWQDIHQRLESLHLDSVNKSAQLILTDLRNLLKAKELVHFHGFQSALSPIISSSSYSFSGKWLWPDQQITEGKYYVFNH